VRWLLAPATFATLLLAIPSRAAGHAWLEHRPFDLQMTAMVTAIVVAPAGCYLGWRKGRPLVGGAAGIAIGVIAASAFWLASGSIGRQAVWAAWLIGWLLCSVLQAQLDGRLQLARALRRGLIASLAGAIGMAIATQQLVAAETSASVSVIANFSAWTLAYWPACAVVLRR
jgi:hypothetical protein